MSFPDALIPEELDHTRYTPPPSFGNSLVREFEPITDREQPEKTEQVPYDSAHPNGAMMSVCPVILRHAVGGETLHLPPPFTIHGNRIEYTGPTIRLNVPISASVCAQTEQSIRLDGDTSAGPVAFSGKAHHYDTGKPRLELLDPYAMRQVGLVLAFGAHKYPSAKNWTKGIEYTRLIGSALRHIFSYMGGEDLDPESGLPHPAHAMCCLMFLLGMTQLHPELDDRETV